MPARRAWYRLGAKVVAVPVQIAPSLVAGDPMELFQTAFAVITMRGHYRPMADGQRYLVLAPLGSDVNKPASVVLKWTAALAR